VTGVAARAGTVPYGSGPVVMWRSGAARRRGTPQGSWNHPSQTARAVGLHWYAEVMGILERALNIGEAKQFRRYEQRVEEINAFEEELELDSDEELRHRVDELRERARGGESLDELLPECFALVRETGRRSMGMRHFDVQLIGGMVLHGGAIAEMRTGEGKTLTATLAVVLNTLAGKGVHVVTVNDYLARRDAEWMSPIYDALGVTVGVLYSGQPTDEKLGAYACDVTYGTNSEFGFDYLRDNMAGSLEEKVQNGGRRDSDGRPLTAHTFAIVDEVDNILIDEARTPLIISGAPEQAADLYVQFAQLARTMVPGKTPEGLDQFSRKQFVPDFDYEFDEKYKTVSVTELGVAKAERFLGLAHLYQPENGHLVNHLHQSLKAESLYKRDVDYQVVEGEVKIIDEFTGRTLEGRRWSEGLHQAIEAKEGVRIQEENQTLATITLQNYFRLYDKLSGMTGTALTEATEFMKIYELQVVQIPTNRPMVRMDRNDQVYKTREGKWSAVEREIAARNATGQPVLVGTISVEVSELLSQRLRRRGIEHSVLNAKPEYAEREGETIAEAGRVGAVTIATNMAGRGVDIKLGGNAEHHVRLELAKIGLRPGEEGYEEHFAQRLPEVEARVEVDRQRVLDAGGLYIVGTERHESRRIDNQLRGRSGRQGDPGESRFFLSAEDELIRLFAGDRIYRILDRLGSVDVEGNEEPIEAGMLSKQIESAQRKVEEQHYLARKHTLEYDDVMNEQRRVIYTLRDQVLEGANLSQARDEVVAVLERTIEQYTAGDYVEDWDLEALVGALRAIYPVSISFDGYGGSERRADQAELVELVGEDAIDQYDAREAQLGEELMRALERFLLLQIIDDSWREHLHDMDYLREGIGLRSAAQIDPLIAYKNEAFTLFEDLMNSVWTEFARLVFNVQVQVDGLPVTGNGAAATAPRTRTYQPSGSSTGGATRVSYSSGVAAGAGALAAAAVESPVGGEAEVEEPPAYVEQRRVSSEEQLGRNDPCWCGSGKKFKRCHGA
jgi:preprotein translocase subunit SecA